MEKSSSRTTITRFVKRTFFHEHFRQSRDGLREARVGVITHPSLLDCMLPYRFYRLFCSHSKALIVFWIGGSFAKIRLMNWGLSGLCKCATNLMGYSLNNVLFFCLIPLAFPILIISISFIPLAIFSIMLF